MVESVLAVVLAGERGDALDPLTRDRAKAAVPFGGKYRVVDFCLSNCLHSGLRRILVLTQYKSHSLHKHLRDGWSIFNPELGEYINWVPPQMRTDDAWYGGSANALYQNLYLLKRSGARHVLVLPGHHVYRMDYAEMMRLHVERRAALTIACVPVPMEQARRGSGVTTGEQDVIETFIHRPEHPVGLPEQPDRSLADMGIYLFSTEHLLDALEADQAREDSSHELARDVVPGLVGNCRAFAYRFGGAAGRVTQDRYWGELETLDDYYEANMALLEPVPPLDLYQTDWHIRTYTAQNPPARTVSGASGNEGIFVNSIIGNGSVIAGAAVGHSVLCPRVVVEDSAVVERSILFEGVRVGEGAELRHCIVDKNVHIPPGTRIGFDAEADAVPFHVTPGGRVVVPKEYRFPSS